MGQYLAKVMSNETESYSRKAGTRLGRTDSKKINQTGKSQGLAAEIKKGKLSIGS